MTPNPERRAELIAAAAAGALTSEETAELDEARRLDPTIDLEVDELRELIGTVSTAVPRWDASAPSAELRQRISRIPGEESNVDSRREATVTSLDAARAARPSRRRWAVSIVAAAACLVLGFGVGALAVPRGAPGPGAADPGVIEPGVGAPGVLGAREQVDFLDEPTGVTIDASVVAHTWGTETILEIDGLPVGESYQLVLIDAEGNAQASGSFLGSTATIDCRMNVATKRPDAASLEIRDASGAIVSEATLPAVAA